MVLRPLPPDRTLERGGRLSPGPSTPLGVSRVLVCLAGLGSCLRVERGDE